MQISGDQIVFLLVSVILASCLINTAEVLRRQSWKKGELFWLYGLFALSVSYLCYGISPWVGRASLMLANAAFLISYVSLVFQLRFWLTGRSDVPIMVPASCLLYIVMFEWSRDYFPYIVRASFGQGIILMLAAYLIWLSIRLFQNKPSRQIMLLCLTFVVELSCALIRLVMLWIQPESTAMTSSILSEPFYMVVVRWIWVLANAMSYLTIMTYTLEKTLDRNDDLITLLKEKQMFINTMTKFSRTHHAGNVASAMTHELSQPLSTLLLLSKNLKNEVQHHGLNQLQEHVEILCKEADKSAKILLELEKLLRTKKVNRQRVSISEIMDGVLPVFSSRLAMHQIKLTLSGRLDARVNVEPTQLELVFINLISNSIQAFALQDGPKRIEIDVSIKEKEVNVEVRDNGPGINLDILQRLGQLYVSDSESGSGVGVWLSKLIVESHQGKLEARNLEGGGASFHVTIPLASSR